MNAPTMPLPLPMLQSQATPACAEDRCVAYVMNGFPRLSETFIANEIYLLEQMGLRLRLFAVKRENEPKVHPVVGAIRARLTYLPKTSSLSGSTLVGWLWSNLPRFARAQLAVASRHPLRYVGALGSALGMSWRYRKSPFALRKVFIKEFLQAAHIAAEVMRDGTVAHLHGHFCHGVATITWFASRLTGIPFSFTAHAKDIYQAELNPGDLLERKLAAASFVATCTGADATVLKARHSDANVVHTIYHGLDTDYFRPELIDDGEQGLLVPPRDPRALADAMHQVLADAELHQRLARAGRARICACFDSRRTTLALRDLFLARIEETTS